MSHGAEAQQLTLWANSEGALALQRQPPAARKRTTQAETKTLKCWTAVCTGNFAQAMIARPRLISGANVPAIHLALCTTAPRAGDSGAYGTVARSLVANRPQQAWRALPDAELLARLGSWRERGGPAARPVTPEELVAASPLGLSTRTLQPGALSLEERQQMALLLPGRRKAKAQAKAAEAAQMLAQGHGPALVGRELGLPTQDCYRIRQRARHAPTGRPRGRRPAPLPPALLEEAARFIGTRTPSTFQVTALHRHLAAQPHLPTPSFGAVRGLVARQFKLRY